MSAGIIDIIDRPGCITKAVMRTYFERAINDTAALKANTPLAAVSIDGEFDYYVDQDTDNMWLGFALGMRCAERIERERARQARDAIARATGQAPT